MPIVKYKCECGYEKKKFFSSAIKITKTIKCDKCEERMKRLLSGPTQRSKMIVDNGVQARETELDREIVEIIEDREKADLKKRGDAVLENLK